MKVKWLLFLLSVPSASVFACSATRSHDVQFERNSAIVTLDQNISLDKWLANIKEDFLNHQGFSIRANAEDGEMDPDRLGKARLSRIHIILSNRGFGPLIESREKVMINKPGAYGPGLGNDVKRVEIDYYPACPRPCGACPQ